MSDNQALQRTAIAVAELNGGDASPGSVKSNMKEK